MRQTSFMKIYKKRWHSKILALSFCMLIILGFILAGIYNYYDHSTNPMIVKNLDDYKMALNNHSYIQVSSNDLYDLNISTTETTSKFGIKLNERITSHLMAIKLDAFILPIDLPSKVYFELSEGKSNSYIFTGHLRELPDEDLSLIKTSISENEFLGTNSQLKPYYQYLHYETPLQSALICFTCAILCLLFIAFLYFFVMRKNNIALKSLKNFSLGNLDEALIQIDKELNLPDTYINGPIYITENYIVVNTQQITLALPLKELVWVYKKTVKQKAGGIITVAKNNMLVLNFSDKKTYTINIPKGNNLIDDVIYHISQNYSTTFVGYSEKLNKLYKDDYDNFIFQWNMKKETSAIQND